MRLPVLRDRSGLRVLDLSDPGHPVEISCAINDDVFPDVLMWMSDRIRIYGDRVYLLFFDGTWSFGHFRLSIYHVSDPSVPWQMGYVGLPDNCSDLFVSGDDVYVAVEGANSDPGVQVIDISDPSAPDEVGAVEFPESPIKRISAWGHHLYVPGVIADPAAPQQIAYWSEPPGYSGLPINVERHGDYAFVACATGG